MKRYLPTPLNLAGACFIGSAIYLLTVIDWEKAELGALLPFIWLGLGFVALVADLILQFFLKNNKGLMYLIQTLFLLLFINKYKEVGYLDFSKHSAYAYPVALIVTFLVIVLTIIEIVSLKK